MDLPIKYGEDYKDLKIFFAGERAVKEAGERFTPRLEGQRKPGMYARYVEFGILFNALSRTRQGMKGAILRKPIDIQFPENQKSILDSIMQNGASFNDLTRETCDAVLGYGRQGVLVDIDDKEDPYAAIYDSLSILKASTVGDKQEIMLKEMIEQPKIDDSGETEWVEQRRKLELINGVYIVTVYQKEAKADGEFIPVPSTPAIPNPRMPKYKGKLLDSIPFTFFGSSSNTPEPSRPPLLDVLCLLKGHWRLTVAYQYALHFTALPTPCFAGFDKEPGEKISLGPGSAHVAIDPTAKSWFMQTGGQGLESVERGLDRLEMQISVVGARLLEGQKSGVEAFETVKLRSAGDQATLADISGNIEKGLTKVLQDIGFWKGIQPDTCLVITNKDFVSTRLDSRDVAALLQAVQANKISEDTFIHNLIKGEIIQEGRTIEQEQEKIAEDKAIEARSNPSFSAIGDKTL